MDKQEEQRPISKIMVSEMKDAADSTSLVIRDIEAKIGMLFPVKFEKKEDSIKEPKADISTATFLDKLIVIRDLNKNNYNRLEYIIKVLHDFV